MKLCLAIAFQNEAPWLRLHLPVLLGGTSAPDGIVALDGGSNDDSAGVLLRCAENVCSVTMRQRDFDWDFAAHMNALVQLAEDAGYDAILRLDPDELIFPDDYQRFKMLLETYSALRLARYNFEHTRQEYHPYTYPDYQTRVWRLDSRIRYYGKVHETLEASFQDTGWVEDGSSEDGRKRQIVMVPHIHIYHYGGLRNDPASHAKFMNYTRTQMGLPPIDISPFRERRPWRFRVPFWGAQPGENLPPFSPFE
jgi:hypothetical protein